ncbi:DUF5034 domain-containing protein [Pedobacter sp. MW01-1-1]|uniref:DUF5034 domain-containing protein n=1 Tax=Pedobacter sp. MW01-1-1 TaxID=3383027 RepID=UPI003FED6835
MIKKIVFVFGFVLITQLLAACVDCDCPPARTIYFTNKGLSLSHLDLSTQAIATSAGKVLSKNYGIRVEMKTDMLTLHKPRMSWSLMSAAYACSCQEDNFISKENIISLKIVSNNDFDATHPKNTDLSLYFKARKGVTFIPILDYIKSSDDYYGRRYAFSEGIFLQVPPTNSTKHAFKVIITLSDNRVIEAETTEIELT